MWDPATYLRFQGERARPFFHLLAALDRESPASVVDLGCGPGHLSAVLAERFEGAGVVGVDNDAAMIETARREHAGPRLRFELGDLETWRAQRAADLVVASASLHWVPDHPSLLPRLVAQLAPRGTLAFQVPDNFDAPSHRLLAELAASPPWRDAFAAAPSPALRGPAVLRPEHYLRLLTELGLRVEAWSTTYLHLLEGEDAVLRWTEGTALRPLLARLSPADAERFLDAYGRLLREAYPEEAAGTLFPFRRTFVVARR